MKKFFVLVLLNFGAFGQGIDREDHVYFIRPVNFFTGDTVKTPVFFGFVDENPICLTLDKMQRLQFYGQIVKSPFKYLVVAFVNETGTFSYSFFHDLDSPILDLHIREGNFDVKVLEGIVYKEMRGVGIVGCVR